MNFSGRVGECLQQGGGNVSGRVWGNVWQGLGECLWQGVRNVSGRVWGNV